MGESAELAGRQYDLVDGSAISGPDKRPWRHAGSGPLGTWGDTKRRGSMLSNPGWLRRPVSLAFVPLCAPTVSAELLEGKVIRVAATYLEVRP
mgnify:CR=1 FL=1